MKVAAATLLMLVGVAIAPLATAQDRGGFYFGGGAGGASLTVWDNNNNNDCCYYYDEHDYETEGPWTSFTAFVGYRFGDYVATEVGYLYVDHPDWNQNYTYIGDLNDVYNSKSKLDYEAGQVSVLGILPFARIWEVYVRVGAEFSHAQADQHLVRVFDGAVVDRSVDNNDTQFLFGIGGGISPTPAWNVRIELTTVSIDNELVNSNDDASIDNFKLEVRYRPFARSAGGRGMR